MLSSLEADLLWQLEAAGLPSPEREFKFHPARKWRLDFAYPTRKIGIECEGGIYSGGRHTRGPGFERDCEKYNAACMAGWKVLRFTAGMVESGSALSVISEALGYGE